MLSEEVAQGASVGNTVVILEQEGLTQMYLRKVLLCAGFRVLAQAQTWQEGLPLIKQSKPDIVLLDVRLMERFDTRTCVQLLQAQARCVILLSSFSEAISQEMTERCGAQGVLTKPLERDTFLCHMQRSCQHLRLT